MAKYLSNVFAKDRSSLLTNLLVFFLCLFTPYLVFVTNAEFLLESANAYSVALFAAFAGVLSVLLRLTPYTLLRILILTCLILLFIDIQFDWIQWWGKKVLATTIAVFLVLWIARRHVSEILVAILGVAVVTTVVTSPEILAPLFGPAAEKRTAGGTKDLPVYVHIILDEQLGIEGFDTSIPSHKDMKEEIGRFLLDNRFRVSSRAYSRFYDSIDAISSTFNFGQIENLGSTYTGDSSDYTLLTNSYFENLILKGYKIKVYQSTYMDFCKSVDTGIDECLTYKHFGVSGDALAGLYRSEKASIVLGLYSKLSFFIDEFISFYNNINLLETVGVSLPEWTAFPVKVGPIPALPVFDTLIEDVSNSTGGTVFLAHLLIPHYPYSVDSSCQIRRPVLKWSKRYTFLPPNPPNSPQSRLARYEEYFSQIRCTLLKLDILLDKMKSKGIYKESTIIIHGDHGSRIVLNEPRFSNKMNLSRRDYIDAFSTLFAVKTPSLEPGFDTRMLALDELLGGITTDGIVSTPLSGKNKNPFIFLRKQGSSELVKLPMPILPFTRNESSISKN